MSREHLGLFDTPPGRREVRMTLAVIGVMVAAFLLVLPISDRPVGEIPAFVPVVDAVVALGELIIATMLFAQVAIFGSRALALLASGFVFIALMLVAHALTFPGAFAPDGLFGNGSNGTAWAMIFRRLALPVIVLLYAALQWGEARTQPEFLRARPPALLWVAGAIALAAICTVLAVNGDDLLPPMFVNRSDGDFSNLLVFNVSNIALLVIAMAVLALKRKSVLDLWLLVALTGSLIQSLLNLPLQARFTVGWYGLFFAVLASHLLVLIALIAESNRLYSRLALSTAARDRERDARLMSVDAMGATFSHEIGQPLTAVTTNTMAALSWLDREEPNVGQAREALRGALDAAQRTANVTKSLRAMVAKEPGTITEFNVNDLAWQTTALLERELSHGKVSLQLQLSQDMPPIQADRVQIQQVLVNLLMNAIESLGQTRGRQRQVTVRSALLDGRSALLEVSDNGAGLAPEQTERIFEPFVTTKQTGTGLGLSICRAIVEEHGGRLWASQGAGFGATFHLQLPCSEMPA